MEERETNSAMMVQVDVEYVGRKLGVSVDASGLYKVLPLLYSRMEFVRLAEEQGLYVAANPELQHFFRINDSESQFNVLVFYEPVREREVLLGSLQEAKEEVQKLTAWLKAKVFPFLRKLLQGQGQAGKCRVLANLDTGSVIIQKSGFDAPVGQTSL